MLLSQYRQWHNNLSKPVFGRKTNQLYPSMPLDDGLYCEASSKEHFAEDKSPAAKRSVSLSTLYRVIPLSQFLSLQNRLPHHLCGREVRTLSTTLMHTNPPTAKEEDIGWEHTEEALPVDVHVRTMPAEEGGGRSPIGRSKEHIKLVDSRGTEAQPTTYEAGFPVSSYPGAQATKSPPLRLS